MCTPAQSMKIPCAADLPPSSVLLANPFCDPVLYLLEETIHLIESLTDSQYTQKPVGHLPSNVASHVRHCLDHVNALLNAVETGDLDYDIRERGTLVESSRTAAIKHTSQLAEKLALLNRSDCEKVVRIKMLMTSDGEKQLACSTVGRELAFVLSHTIHHNAIIGAMVKTLGGNLPDRFGYAPSTPKVAV